jgi:hypothetical protein
MKGAYQAPSRAVNEFLDRGAGTQLVLTDEGEDAGEHATGWAPALNHLARLLE